MVNSKKYFILCWYFSIISGIVFYFILFDKIEYYLQSVIFIYNAISKFDNKSEKHNAKWRKEGRPPVWIGYRASLG